MPVVYAYSTDGLPIYDARGRNLVDVGGNIYNVHGNQFEHFDVGAGNPLDGDPAAGGAPIAQPTLGRRIQFLMTVSGSLPFATPGGAAQIAMAPARVSRNPIDCGTKMGFSLHDCSTKSLFVVSKDAFDLKSNGLMDFLDAINRRGRECGWQIFTMNNTAGDHPKDLLTECGDLTVDNVIAHATAVFTIHPLTQNAQEDGQLFACINNSMTQGAIDVLNLRQDKFLLPAPINEHSGICFLRVIIAEAQVDTRATTNLLLGQLTSGLPDIMAKEGGNIRAFNQQVLSIVCRVKRPSRC